MTVRQQIITIAVIAAGTILTRFIPFILFPKNRPVPDRVHYLGDALPPAVFGLLVVYCLRNVDVLSGSHGLPELLGIAVTAAAHLWKKQMLLSIAAGTISYMLLVQFVFV